jgi:predicted ATPase
MEKSGLEDEYDLAATKPKLPKLIYIKNSPKEPELRLKALLTKIRDEGGVSYKRFSTPEELGYLLENDLAILLTWPFIQQVTQSQSTNSSDPAHFALPIVRTAFIGRKKVLNDVYALIHEPDVCLITLTGPGGIGKTRLALQVANNVMEDFPHGVFFVPLSSIQQSNLIIPHIRKVLRLPKAEEVTAFESLKDYLHDKNMLLVLDNFEQLASGAAILSELLSSAHQLKLIVTSRALLHLRDEREFQVPPLDLPKQLPAHLTSLETLSENEAIALFVQYGRANSPKFEITPDNYDAVAQICIALDGIPLAIELAASRVRLLAPEVILQKVSDHQQKFRFLRRKAADVDAKQLTLEATIDWSYGLLKKADRALFLEISTFVGGCTVSAVQAVCGLQDKSDIDVLDKIESLVDQSLVQVELFLDAPRFRMLETIREYAMTKLTKKGNDEVLKRKHAEFYLALAEEASPHLRGTDASIWSERLEVDLPNIRKALEWSLLEEENLPVGLEMAGALGWFWEVRGYIDEGLRWLTTFLSRTTQHRTMARARALFHAGRLSLFRDDYSVTEPFYQESLEIYKELGDKAGVARALMGVGSVASHKRRYATAHALYEESLELRRELGDKGDIAHSLDNLGGMAKFSGNYVEARLMLEQSLSLRLQLGVKRDIGMSHVRLGRLSVLEGNYVDGRRHYEAGLQAFRDADHPHGTAWALTKLAQVAMKQSDYSQAEVWLKESLMIGKEIGKRNGSIAETLAALASVHQAQGRSERAAWLWGATEGLIDILDYSFHAADFVDYYHNTSDIAGKIDPHAFLAAWELGRHMSPEQAIEYALSDS